MGEGRDRGNSTWGLPPRAIQRSFRYGCTNKLITIQLLLDLTTEDLFCKMKSFKHCLHPLLPPYRTLNQVLRTRCHSFQLPACSFNFQRNPLSSVVFLSFLHECVLVFCLCCFSCLNCFHFKCFRNFFYHV